jgi:hypothetical protein
MAEEQTHPPVTIEVSLCDDDANLDVGANKANLSLKMTIRRMARVKCKIIYWCNMYLNWRLTYSRCRRSYTTSLSSSVENYKWENGRRYHSYREGCK